MALDFRKMSFGQLLAIGGGVFVLVVVIAAFVISSTRTPPPKVVTKRPVQFEAPTNNLETEQLRTELKQLRELVETNAQALQAALTQTAGAIDRQSAELATLNTGMQVTANRVNNLEKQRLGTRVNIVRPEDQTPQPNRTERRVAAERGLNASKPGSSPMRLSNSGDYIVSASVGNRVWIRHGNEEFSVREGEALPVNGQLVLKRVAPDGQVSVGIESLR